MEKLENSDKAWLHSEVPRLFNPAKVNELNPDATTVESLRIFKFIDSDDINNPQVRASFLPCCC